MTTTPSLRLFASSAAICVTAAMAATLPAAAAVTSDSYPTRTITMLVPIGAGGVADTSARLFSKELSKYLNVPIVVQNRPGGSQSIGAESVARAAPDGYTLLFSTSGFVAAPLLVKGFKPDPIKDFEPVSLIASSNNVLVGSNAIAGNTLKDLVQLSKSKPGQVFYGSPSGATTLVFEHLNQVTGAKIQRILYQSTPAAWADLIGGRIHAVMEGPKLALAQVKAGNAKVLAVFGSKRSPEFPNVPTVAEQGYPGFGIETWQGLWAPKGTPAAVIQKLEKASLAVMSTPQMKEKMRASGLDAIGSTAAGFKKQIGDDANLWSKVAAGAGIKPQ
ncbi:Bug family tripartite tricarboxylate transporter substrate binding protein [Candidimonas nitroreducens]|uniref:LacI family transcriptional regulator n=1 Tax=Candidimonas nitroreducens TaxID=683354 RepID=A0A225MFM5_9BURK|nr:tripartite tricarboxylate transporter substrate binding protein [Candidimonas nitroreducens]OWT60065.1 LacI family transcriptional regulator [Candidimonas nitroreducens]